MAPGQDSGQVGFSWTDFVDGLIAERGSLAAVALFVAERRSFEEDVPSVERGLRRLRTKASGDGGVWGQRALACFGLPASVSDRIRWMGHYHTRFSDLPVSLCEELLRPWDRPPVSESPARIWVLLGRVGTTIRRKADPAALLEQAALLETRSEAAAQVELALVRAYVDHRMAPEAAEGHLQRAQEMMLSVEGEDASCLFARWVDQKAYPLNRPRTGPPDHRAAVALYESIPADGPPFARCRRENGLGWSRLSLGDRTRAEQHAEASVESAGDSGSLRLRAMALNLLAACRDDATLRQRALSIAQRLEDEALAVRFRPRKGYDSSVAGIADR